MVKIRRVSNGWVVFGSLTQEEQVFEIKDGESEAHAFARLLWHLIDELGPEHSRHSEWVVRVNVEHGDKWSENSKNV